jgi:hypothetical protein
MAYVDYWTCLKCGGSKHSVVPSDYICSLCTQTERERKRREHFGTLDACSIAERLRKVEEWQYSHSHDGLVREEIRF